MNATIEFKSHAFRLLFLIAVGLSLSAGSAHAQSAAIFVKLLEKTPPERQANLIKLICQRANADELRIVFDRLTTPGKMPDDVQLVAIQELATAAADRKVLPSGDLSGLKDLLKAAATNKNPEFLPAAIRLSGLWKVDVGEPLAVIATAADAKPALRRAALNALVEIGGASAEKVIAELADAKQPPTTRVMALAALARLDADRAVSQSVKLFAAADRDVDLSPLILALLDSPAGAAKLAAAVNEEKLSPDAAKRLLRSMYAVGRSDGELVQVLTVAAGITAEVAPLTDEQKQSLIAEILAKGDPQRGEGVFRRADLSCLKCHSVSGAGGNIGPELSNLGAGSPVDYILESILFPDKAIKEEFISLLVLDADGRVHQGIKVARDEQQLVLKDANGVLKTIPAADIEDEKPGKSLMPKGLTAFMTHDEFVDLVRFISELGKPGPYAVRKLPTFQRWRLLASVPPELAAAVPDAATFRAAVLEADETAWENVYAKVAGALPLDEFLRPDRPVLYLRSEIDVTAAGAVGIRVDSIDGLAIWADAEPVKLEPQMQVELSVGRHWITFRVNPSQRTSREITAGLFAVEGSAAQAATVNGR